MTARHHFISAAFVHEHTTPFTELLNVRHCVHVGHIILRIRDVANCCKNAANLLYLSLFHENRN